MNDSTLVLPVNVASRSDVVRLIREVEALDEFMQQTTIRAPGTSLKLPKSSRLLDNLATDNQLNMLHAEDRRRIKTFLMAVRAKAPVLHMSFSVDPSPLFLEKLMTYIRREIHPLALVHTGLQPNIGAGCILRTTNKHFDFSLRQRFLAQRGLLLEKLHSDIQVQEPVQPASGVKA